MFCSFLSSPLTRQQHHNVELLPINRSMDYFSDHLSVPFLRNFHWGAKQEKKADEKYELLSRRGLANARV
jgi:hypothetical protein